MDHPHIARVFDAGATEAGRPYFVMELVRGVPITDYCDQSQLSTNDRLKLFLAVCRAVQHAHQKGIIHRDIKPSNILVTLHDGAPVVKVIDFGVAKAIGQELTEKTIYTAFSQMVGTPLYMSPEQAGMNGLDIDTRSDIYSLGVVLYELLTGTTPFDQEQMRGANFDEIRRMLQEDEPPKPSTRISTLGRAATTLSTQRGSDPRRLSELFRGELDWIVMKALEKDRNRRYDTAAGLAADIERHLNDEPVLACPPSTWYRFRKVTRRNKRALLTAAALCGTVMAGLVLMSVSYLRLQTEQARTTHEYDRAETERAVADEQRAEAESRLKLVLEALGEVYIKQAEEISTLRQQANERGAAADPRREQAEREFLEKGLLFYEKLARRPGASPEAQAEMGRALHTVSVIRSRLGHNEESARAMRQAALLFENLTKQFPEEAYYALEQADAWHWLYHPLSSSGHYDEAEQATRTALAIFQKLPGNLQTDFRTRRCLANCYDHLTRLGARRGRLADALRDFKLAEQAYEQLTAESPLETEYRANSLHLRVTLAPYFAASGQQREAAAFFSAAVAGFEKLVSDTAVDGAAQTTTNGRPSGIQDNAWYRFELGFTCVSQGDLLRQLGQLTD